MTELNQGLVNSEELKAMDIEDALDLDFNAIADLPDYSTPVRGYYELAIDAVKQEEVDTADGTSERFTIVHRVVRCIEKTNADDADTPEGTLFTMSFLQGASLQHLKKLYLPVIIANNCKNLRELFALLPTIHIQAEIAHRFAKDDKKAKEKPFADLQHVTRCCTRFATTRRRGQYRFHVWSYGRYWHSDVDARFTIRRSIVLCIFRIQSGYLYRSPAQKEKFLAWHLCNSISCGNFNSWAIEKL